MICRHLNLVRFSRARAVRCLSSEAYLADSAPTANDIARLQENFKQDPESAKVSFNAKGMLTTGLRSTVNIRDKFYIQFDEPKGLGGTDLSFNPVEAVLAALGTCQEITYKAFSRAGNAQIDELNSRFTGDIDLRGFFAVSDDARAGFYKIVGDVDVASRDLSTNDLKGLKQIVDTHCPVLDTLANPVEVSLGLTCVNNSPSATEDDAPTASDIAGLQANFRADLKVAQAQFAASTSLQQGLRSRATIRDTHQIQTDEPVSLGGQDIGCNPVELLLACLASCQEITYKAYGRAMGLELNKVSCSVKGHLDLRGFFAVDPSVRPGFYKIEGEVVIDSPASPEQLNQLKQVVDAHCPVLDMLVNPVPTTIRTKIKQ